MSWQVGDVTRQISLVIGRHMNFYCTIFFKGDTKINRNKFMNGVLASDDIKKYENLSCLVKCSK